ncbi:hypothetical protein EB796_005947 [Bugula neritina]|uniref:Uncharacterized protein n=1 Tax=Bugula neritina TaxID=10212 RepID=A0A7J7KCS7_BUGNE|nr:hypothetical protein EB796_005947 [Bugula neritina]
MYMCNNFFQFNLKYKFRTRERYHLKNTLAQIIFNCAFEAESVYGVLVLVRVLFIVLMALFTITHFDLLGHWSSLHLIHRWSRAVLSGSILDFYTKH